MKMLLIAALAIPLWSQTKPSSIALIGTECGASTTPKCGGMLTLAIPIAQSDTYSWTKIYQAAPGKSGLPASVTTTGLAKRLWTAKIGQVTFDVMGLGGVGAASTATASTAAFNAGGGLAMSGISKRWPWLKAWCGALQEKAGSNSTRVSLALGGAW